jgi:hypothetical protein
MWGKYLLKTTSFVTFEALVELVKLKYYKHSEVIFVS